MQIKNKLDDNKTNFSTILAGQVFLDFFNEPHIKTLPEIYTSPTGSGTINAVSLLTGHLVQFTDDAKIRPIITELTILKYGIETEE